MIRTPTLAAAAIGLVLSTLPLRGQDLPRYRDFQLGGDMQSVSTLTGVALTEVKTIHARPAMMQELQWRPRYSSRVATPGQTEAIQQIVFSFYSDQLNKLVIDYDRDRTAGMTDADMIEAISIAYGVPLKPVLNRTRIVPSLVEVESGPPIARWGDSEHSVALYRVSYASAFRLIVIATRLEALAKTADAQAVRLDEREAPQREMARQKKEREDARISEEKARLANKATFRP